MKLIINADDLALSVAVNDAVFELMGQRRITSATILANGPAFTDAIAQAIKFPNCSFGVHLNVSEFRPLTQSGAFSAIVDQDGLFIPDRVRQARIDRALKDAVFAEWDAQVQRVKAAGIAVSHIDSHFHAHTIAGLFPVVKRLQRRHAITKVRIATNLYPARRSETRVLLWKKRIWNAALRHYGPTVTTGGFCDVSTFYEAGQERVLAHDTFELMSHPGDPSSQQETVLLTENWRERLKFETSLISYNDLL